MAWARLLGFLGTSLALGCGAGGGTNHSLDVGSGDGGRSFEPSETDGGQGAFDAHIEQGQVAVKLVTLSCSGDCATVEAVGTGGYPPYTFAWDDGSTNPVRQVCPTATARYSVTVADTGAAGEFPRPAETAQASVTADVLACPDAGVTSTATCDSGAATPKAGTYTGPYTSRDLGGLQTGSLTLTFANPSGTQLSGSFGADLIGVLHNAGSFTGSVNCSTGAIVVGGTSDEDQLYVYTMTFDPSTESLTGTWSYTCPTGCNGQSSDGGGDSGTFAVTLVDSGS
jgi:hypothetical protein